MCAARLAETAAEIERCFPVMQQLRPLLVAAEFVDRIMTQQAQGFRLALLEEDGVVVAVAGFRVQEMLASGRTCYVDDLVTDAGARSRGHGKAMLDWLAGYAREAGCATFSLDSGTFRQEAHAFYFREGNAGDELPLYEDAGIGAWMTPRPAPSKAGSPEQTVEQIAAALEDFLAAHPGAVVLEDGKALFAMDEAKYTLATEHGRCTLHLWNEERNLVRRVSAAVLRAGVLRLSTHRFGQAKPQTLELVADRDRRTPSTREATRLRYLRTLERVLLRAFPDWKTDALRTAMDLERSFGPAYARGSLVRGQQAWAVIAVNEEETQGTVDGVLTLGILWLSDCREQAGGRRLYQGLRVIVPRGMGVLTLSRLAWLNEDAAQWELWELDERSEELEPRDAADHGNLATRLVRAPNEQAARERFGDTAARVMGLVPETMRPVVEQRLRSGTELAFLIHGLEFARVRMGVSQSSFNRELEISFGAGANETPLTTENEDELRELTRRLFLRRTPNGSQKDPLFRMQPERWLEGVLRRNLEPLDPHLDPAHVYTQVPAFAAADRGMLDLLGVGLDGRLAVIELKAEEDLHLALQGLDYWVRVRWHHLQNPDPATGLGVFQQLGYFGGLFLSPEAPRLYLAAPALRIHPATETVLRYLSPRVEWTLVALDERWRRQIKVVWRKRSGG